MNCSKKMDYEYYERVKVLKPKVRGILISYARLCCRMIEEDKTRDFDPGYTFRHLPALKDVLVQAQDIFLLTMSLHRTNSTQPIPFNTKNLINEFQIQDIVSSLLKNENLLSMVNEICFECFSPFKILEYLVCFIANLKRIIYALNSINESFVAYECLLPNGQVDLRRLSCH